MRVLALLAVAACQPGGANQGTAVGNPGDAELSVGEAWGLRVTSATTTVAGVVAIRCDDDGERHTVMQPGPDGEVDLVSGAVQLPPGRWCGPAFVSVSEPIEVVGDGDDGPFAVTVDADRLHLLPHDAAGFEVDGGSYELRLGRDGWLSAELLATPGEDPARIGVDDVRQGRVADGWRMGSGLYEAGLPVATGPVREDHAAARQPRFVAVGDEHRRLSSIDGVVWENDVRTGIVDKALYAVTWGNGRYVAVGADKVFTSFDGIHWDMGETGKFLYGVAYGDGRFAAVGEAAVRLWSDDGLHWNYVGGGTTDRYKAIAWGDQGFVAVGHSGIRVRSEDGVTWMDEVTGGYELYGVAWGNGRYVAVGADGRRAVSLDAEIWSDDAFGDPLEGITFGDGEFFAVGTGRVERSTSGEVWDAPVSPGLAMGHIAYGDGNLVVAGWPATLAWSDDLGDTWQVVSEDGPWIGGVGYGGAD
jgi:hypothetical protein